MLAGELRVEHTEKLGDVSIGLLAKDEIPALLELLAKQKVSFAGYAGVSMHKLMCSDALRQTGVVCLVVRIKGGLAGYVFALIGPQAYWRNLCWRRPVLFARILLAKMRKGVNGVAHPPALPEELMHRMHLEDGKESWKDSSPELAKVQFIGVRAECEGMGLGGLLYRACFTELKRRGVKRVDAHVDAANVRSLWLHVNTGWTVHYHHDAAFAVRYL